MRRLNVKLALWLVGITVFSAVGVHLLHGYQINRNADFLKVQAETARKDNKIEEAISKYGQYLRHRDDREGYQALSELVVEVAKKPESTNQQKIRAYSILEEAIRRHDNLDDVRASLVDFTMMVGRFSDAQEHIRRLKENGKSSAELDYKSAFCSVAVGEEERAREKLSEMLGLDPITGQFAEQPPATAKEIDAYVLLARLLRTKGEEPRADAVMEQLVKWNPDSGRAHLTRGRYLLAVADSVPGDTEESKKRKTELVAAVKAEFETALKVAPNDMDTILALATTSMLERDFAKAQELLDRARKEHPDRQEVYVAQAELAKAQGKFDQANDQLQAGLEHAADSARILQQLIEVQFQLNDMKAVRATIERMHKIDAIPREYIRYQEARLKLQDSKIIEATREFEQVRSAVERLGPEHAQRVNSLLARCYELLGLPDQQLAVYRRLLGTYPNLVVARVGEASALQALGRHDEAETAIALLAVAAEQFPVVRGTALQLAINQQLSKPKAERNWAAVEKIAEALYQDETRTPLMNRLLKADILMAQERNDEAQEILMALRNEHPKEVAVWVSLCRLLMNDENNREKVPQLLALAEKEIGNVPQLELLRARAVMAAPRGEVKPEELKKLEAGIGDKGEAEQRAIYAQLATAYLRAGDYDNAKRCFQSAMAKDPSNGRIRQLVFELAMERQDKELMQAILKDIGDSVYFGPESALYKYCAACSKLLSIDVGARVKKGGLTEEDRRILDDVRRLAEEARQSRAEWAPVWRVLGEVDQLEGNAEGAIKNYQQSLNYSRFNQETTARRLVALLYAAGRFTEANDALKYLSGAEGSPELREITRDIKYRVGDLDTAVEMARADVEKYPDNPSTHLAYGRVLYRVGKSDEAEQAFRKASEVAPQLPEVWQAYVTQLLDNRKKNEAVEAVRAASKAIAHDVLALAALYQQVGDVQQAEQLYESALAAKPGDPAVLRQVIEFNFAVNQPDKAMEYLDQLIAMSAKAQDQTLKQHVQWARRRKAQRMAQFGDYQNTIAAVKLIEQNAENGKLSPTDMVNIVAVLGDRPEHESRATAIKYLEQLQAGQGLQARQMTALARLYELEGNWQKARDMMFAAINSRSDDPAVFTMLATMLLNHDEAEEARKIVDRAEELVAKSSEPVHEATRNDLRVARARLLALDGDKAKAAQLIEGMVSRPLPQNQLGRLAVVSQQMEKLGLYEGAEKLLGEYAVQDERAALALAAYKGRRGDVAESFKLLEDSRKSQPVIEIIPVALEVLRYYPKEQTKERFQMLEEWARVAAKIEGNPYSIKLILAEMYDLQGRYDEVIKIYRELLTDPKAPPGLKARVQNNLAFVLAVVEPTPERTAEALELIEDAIKVLGPSSDLLDTRAMVYLAQGKLKQAAEDMRWALVDSPSISKYFHLAQVEKQLGNTEAAREAINKAVELRGDHNPFTPAERRAFEQLQQELN